jgi:hypothetical protein
LKDHAICGTKFANGRAQYGLQLVLGVVLFGIGTPIFNFIADERTIDVRGIIHRHFVATTPTHTHEGFIHSNADKPSVETGISPKRRQVEVGFYEGVLHHVFGVFAVSRDVLRKPEYPSLVFLDEPPKRVRGSGLRLSYKIVLVHLEQGTRREYRRCGLWGLVCDAQQHFRFLPSRFSDVQAGHDVFHIGATRDQLHALRQNLAQQFFSLTIDTDDVFEVHYALPALTRALRFVPPLPQVNGPLPAEFSLKDPRLFESCVCDHRP